MFSRLGCHHQKGGECNCKLLKSCLKHWFWWRQHGYQHSKDVQKVYQYHIKPCYKSWRLEEELLKKQQMSKGINNS